MVFHTRQSFCYLIAAKKAEELQRGAHTDSSLAVVVILFRLLSKFAKLCLRKDKKKELALFFLFTALHYTLGNITFFYLLQTLNGHGYRCLVNENAIVISVFSCLYLTIFCLINLKINFYCI